MKYAMCATLVAAALSIASMAVAGTKFQTSLVPNVAGSQPGFASSGASIKLDDQLRVKGKVKTVVDAAGDRVTTDIAEPLDDYTVEVDLTVPATAVSGTISIPFDVKNGNGKFAADIGADPVFAGAAVGDGVAIEAVRVLDPNGAIIGVGGVAVR